MNQQPADLPRFVQVIGQYRTLVRIMAVLGLLGGVVFAALNPPVFTSRALVMYQPVCPVGSICGGPEFALNSGPAKPPATLPIGARAKPAAGNVLTVSAVGGTAAQAEAAADAAARQIAGAGPLSYQGEPVSGVAIEPATTAAGTPQQLFGDAVRGAVLGVLLGILVALAASRTTIDSMTAPRGAGFRAGEEDKATGRGAGYAPTGVWLSDLAREHVERQTALDTSLGRSQADPP
ncbi:MAG: hypothetical protein ACRDPY_26350 [Streptosporangiaceae bacterium]